MSTPKQSPVLQAMTAALKSGPARKREDEFYKPRPQDYFTYTSKGEWKPAASIQGALTAKNNAVNPQTIRLISWNIDMLIPFGDERMTAALSHLESLVASTPPDVAIVIFLQEMTASDLALITSSSWVQQRFFVTDIDNSNWLSPYYGTTTLIDARLHIVSGFRVPWISKFDRDGLFVDVALSGVNASSNAVPTDDPKVLRLCNVHLESLIADPPIRPLQLSAAAEYLHAPNVASALLAGDLNAIQLFDRTLHTDKELKDAYLELGGKEDDDNGYTWGYQVPKPMREQFGCSRMDKILFRGDVEVKAFERIGIDVRVAEDEREKVRESGEEEWVSDHYGVMGDFEMGNDWNLAAHDQDWELERSKLS